MREGVDSLGSNADSQLLSRWQTTCQSAWLGCHSAAYNLTRITAQRICGSLPLPARTELSVGQPGTRNVSVQGDPLAPWLSLAVNESTGLAGRSRHGRFFMSGGYEGDVTGESLVVNVNQWNNLVLAYIAALNGAFVTGTPPLDWVLVVHSKKLAAQPGTQCNQSSTPVTGLSLVARLTTQRSRRA